MCTSLKQMFAQHNIEVDMGQLEETPCAYSPFYRSRSDLFFYHKDFYKQNIVTSVVASGVTDEGDYDRDDSENVCTVAGVCEMKNAKKVM